jgi:hypothetical protein
VTVDGHYYVGDDAAEGWQAQIVTGVLFRAGRSVAFRFGYETAVKGGSLGVYLMR